MGYLLFATALIAFFLFLMISMTIRNRRAEREYKEHLYHYFGEQTPVKISAVGKQKIADSVIKRKSGFLIDDITWKDLQMDEVYDRLARVETQAGEEYLYELLRSPLTDRELLKQRELRIRYFQEHPAERVGCQMFFHKLGKQKDAYSLYEQIDLLEKTQKQSSMPDYAATGLLVFSTIMIMWNFPVGIGMLVAVCIYNILSYFRRKAKVLPCSGCIRYLLFFVTQAGTLPHLTGVWQEENHKLTDTVRKLKSLKKGAFLLPKGDNGTTSNPFSVLMDYVNMLLHFDLLWFHYSRNQILKHKEEARKLIHITGKIEAMIAVAAFRAGDRKVCVPEYQESGITAAGLYHPLLTEPVANDLDTKDCILITGSNASGKSTFLRTVALNILLSQTIHTCMAESFKAPCRRLYTSISISDDLLKGESSYVAEIRALKRVIDAAEEPGAPVIAFIDEILRGTNTLERIAAAAQILKYLKGQGVLCFAATHDEELTVLLQKEYNNYHFTEEIRNGEVVFPYRLEEGQVNTGNAIRLLAGMGYDKKITEAAEKMASDFLEKGVWSC